MVWLQVTGPTLSPRADLLRTLGAGLLGLLGTLITLLFGWLRERDVASKRTKVLDESARRVDVWGKWYSAVKELEQDEGSLEFCRVRFREELTEISKQLSSAFPNEEIGARRAETREQYDRRLLALPLWRRLLLVYKPPRPRAWIMRGLLYTFLAMGAISISSDLANRAADLNKATVHLAGLQALNDGSPKGRAEVTEWQTIVHDLRYENMFIQELAMIFFLFWLYLVFGGLSVWLEQPKNSANVSA